MTFNCTLTQTGLDPQISAKAFVDSYNQTSQLSYYTKYQQRLEQYFINKIDRNISQNQIKDNNLKDSFSLNFKNNTLQFISSNRNSIKYEYGSGTKSPKRFIQPAVFDTANELSEIIISEAITNYSKNSRFGQGIKRINIPNIQSNYFNKYSKMLK